MRDQHHLAAGRAQPHNVVSAVDGDPRAQKYRCLGGRDGSNRREALYNLPAVGERARGNQWDRLPQPLGQTDRPKFLYRIGSRVELTSCGNTDAAVSPQHGYLSSLIAIKYERA